MDEPEDCFRTLPIEIRQHIGQYIESDQDLRNYARACPATWEAIEQDNSSFWRRRFMLTFDNPKWKALSTRARDNERYRQQYALRQVKLANPVKTGAAQNDREYSQLKLMLELIMQSFHPSKGIADGDKNMSMIISLTERSRLHTAFQPFKMSSAAKIDLTKVELLFLVQCLLAPAVIDMPARKGVFGYDHCQYLAYSHPQNAPYFKGLAQSKVNLELVLSNLTYWKQWLHHEPTMPTTQIFEALTVAERPSFWKYPLSNQLKSLSPNWKGVYGYLDEDQLVQQRSGIAVESELNQFFADEKQETFQDLFLKEGGDAHYWPSIFERHLQALQRRDVDAKTRAQRKTFPGGEVFTPNSSPFQGHGLDQTDSFFVTGWLNSLPEQMGVPGWKRFTMMKYFLDDRTGMLDEESLWAYEGVVIPGDRVIVGRWWRAEEHSDLFYSGPFILWAVDKVAKQSAG